AVQPPSEIGQKSRELHKTIVLGLARRARFLPPELPRDYTNVGRISIQIAVYPAPVGIDVRLLLGPFADSNQEPFVVRLPQHLMDAAFAHRSDNFFPFRRPRRHPANVQPVYHNFDLGRRTETERRVLTSNVSIDFDYRAQNREEKEADENAAPHFPVEFVDGL